MAPSGCLGLETSERQPPSAHRSQPGAGRSSLSVVYQGSVADIRASGGQRWSDAFLSSSFHLFSLEVGCLAGATIQVGWLARGLQESACLLLPSARIMGAPNFSYEYCSPNSGPRTCVQVHSWLTHRPSPSVSSPKAGTVTGRVWESGFHSNVLPLDNI